MVSLLEVGTLYKLNDGNVLAITVLPVPIIKQTSMSTYVTTQSSSHFNQRTTSSQVYTTHFKVKFDGAFNSDFLDFYRQKYLDQILCRVGSRLLWVLANSTWIDVDQIQCTLINFYNFKPECVEVSINNGL